MNTCGLSTHRKQTYAPINRSGDGAGQCLVPLADIFNHKAAVVEVGGDLAIAELDDESTGDDASSGDAPDDDPAAEHGDDVVEGIGAGEDTAAGEAAEPDEQPALKRPRGAGTVEEGLAGGAAGGGSCGAAPAADPKPESCAAGSCAAKKQRVEAEPEAVGAADTAAGTPCGTAALACKKTSNTMAAEGSVAVAAPGECLPDCPGGLPCCAVDDEDAEEEQARRAVQLQRLQERLGVNLGLEIAIIDQGDLGAGEGDSGTNDGDGGGAENDAGAGKQGGKPAVEAEVATRTEQLRIVAVQPIAAGREVHNTYGEYGNAALIYKHGFALRTNPFDAVSVTIPELRAAVAAAFGDKAADARMRAADACLREAAGEGEENQEEEEEDRMVEIVKQLELCGPECAEAHMQSGGEVRPDVAAFVTFPLFAAIWAAGVDAEVVEAATATEGLVASALTELAAAAKDAGADVNDVAGEHVDLLWVVRALPDQSRRVLAALLDSRNTALDAAAAKLEKVWSEVEAYFQAETSGVASWHGCTKAEVAQSLLAIERLTAREREIVKGAKSGLSEK
eukprot:jgi/Ulvmu1/6876/UM031_0081.1